MKAARKRKASLTSYGARRQVRVAVALLAVIPILVVGFIAVSVAVPDWAQPAGVHIAVILLTLALAATGYRILRKYPENIVRLRDHLSGIARGELAREVLLLKEEDDLAAIEKYLNMIITEMRNKMNSLQDQLALARKLRAVIESQAGEIIAAERHRVMIESLGTACHHLGQPVTVLASYLALLEREPKTAETAGELAKCEEAVSTIRDILDKLRKVSQYRTVPYQTFHLEDGRHDDERILDIEQ